MIRDPRLAIVRNLLRIYREVLEEPAPVALIALLTRLEAEGAPISVRSPDTL